MNFEKSEIYSKFETQTKYVLTYWKLSENEKFDPSNYSALTRPPYWGGHKHKKWGWPRISKFAGGLSPLCGVNKGDQEFKYKISTMYMSIQSVF